MTLNGYVRLTEYIDILVDIDENNIAKLILSLGNFVSLGNFGEGYGGDLLLSDFTPEPGAIRIVEETESVAIDIFIQIGGLTYDDLIGDTEVSRILGRPFRYASKTQLIQIKRESHREKDQIDVSALKQLLRDPRSFD